MGDGGVYCYMNTHAVFPSQPELFEHSMSEILLLLMSVSQRLFSEKV
jgi:hypothetical protein